jgi:hypothetical protein
LGTNGTVFRLYQGEEQIYDLFNVGDIEIEGHCVESMTAAIPANRLILEQFYLNDSQFNGSLPPKNL